MKQYGGKMKEIKEQELESIKGGGITSWIGVGIGAAVVFLIGFFDGFTRPLGCNK